MNTPAHILNSNSLNATIAEAVGYNHIESGTALMVKINDASFELVPSGRVNARTAQGWVEAVSAATMDQLGLVGETSDDGIAEAEKIVTWMRQQA